MDPTAIYAIERPHANLMKLYVLRALMSGPFVVLTLPVLYFRYTTLRYNFDEEGISMRWGILFRREINLTYARIQDIHLNSGVLQRWLGLADIQIQTASGNAGAEMIIEGLQEYEPLRDFLYARMRGRREEGKGAEGATMNAEAVKTLLEIRDELRGARRALEASQRNSGGLGGGHV